MKIERIIGADLSEEEKKDAVAFYERRFEGSSFSSRSAEMIKKERKKTPEEVAILSLANEVVGEFVGGYGIEPVRLTEGHHHFLNGEDWEFDNSVAFYNQGEQRIFYRHYPSLSKMFNTATHEILHFNSYQASLAERKEINGKGVGIKFSDYRIGWDTRSLKEKDRFSFVAFNEGLTEEVVKFLWQKVSGNELFAKEAAETDFCRAELEKKDGLRHINRNSDVYKISRTPGKEESWDVEAFAFVDNRRAISLLLDKMVTKLTDEARQAIAQAMVRGMLDGNMLPFARMVKECFGEGAFRNIGEANTGKDLLKTIENL